ncbi:MAG: hypothetical protein D6731_15970, partial [Planctomycetota bacterium]
AHTAPTPPSSTKEAERTYRRAVERARRLAAAGEAWGGIAAALDEARAHSRTGSAQEYLLDLLSARLRIARGRHRSACEKLDALRKRLPPGKERAEATALLALARWRAGERTEARRRWEELAHDAHAGPWALWARARLRGLDGRRTEALRAARDACGVRPGEPLFQIERGLAALDADLTQEATRSLEDAAQRAPGLPLALQALGALRLRTGDTAEALRLLRRAADLEGPGAPRDLRLLHALASDRAGARVSARSSLEALLEEDPEDLDVRVHLGALLAHAGATERAASLWRAARAQDPKRCRRSLVRWHDEETLAAFDRLSKRPAPASAAERLPPLGSVNEEALRDLAHRRWRDVSKLARVDLENAFLRLAKGAPWDEVEFLFERAQRAARKSATPLLLALASFQIGRGRIDDARRALDALRRSELSREERSRLAWLDAEFALRRGRLGEAFERFSDLAGAFPARASAARAQAQWLRGSYGEALAAADAALAEHPQDAPSAALRAQCLFALGRLEEALQATRAAYALAAAADGRVLALRVAANAGRVTAHLTQEKAPETLNQLMRMAGTVATAATLRKELDLDESGFASRLCAQLLLCRKSAGARRAARDFLNSIDLRGPRTPHLLLALGYAELLSGRADEGARRWKEARRLDPSLPIPLPYQEALRRSDASEPLRNELLSR